MSLVVAIKYNNGVVIGADRQLTQQSFNRKKENSVSKVRRSKYSNTAWGAVGDHMISQYIEHNVDDLMRYKDILDKREIDMDYVIDIAERFRNILSEGKRLETINGCIDDIRGSFMIVSSNKIYIIERDTAVIEEEDFATLGSGQELARGYLETVKGGFDTLSEPEAEHLVERCIKDTCKNDITIDTYVDMIILSKKGGR